MNTWQLTWNGLRTVTGLELRQRIRSKRWIWVLAAWFLVIGGVTWLILAAIPRLLGFGSSTEAGLGAGPLAFGTITFFVLGMGLVIAPAFTATSINGDRSAGTLALLQATRLSALEIALGKLVAAWLTAAVFLVVVLPFIAASMVWGDISIKQVLLTFLVVFAEVAVICAIGIGWSSLLNRPAMSTMMTYLSVVFLTVISLIVLGLLVPMVMRNEQVRVWGLPPSVQAEYDAQTNQFWEENPNAEATLPAPVGKCAWYTQTEPVSHLDQIWWISLVNPFVIVADAAPLPPTATKDLGSYVNRSADPLAWIRYSIRMMAQPSTLERDDCTQLYATLPGYEVGYSDDDIAIVTTSDGTPVNVNSPVKRRPVSVESPIWPWGLGANVLLGGAFFWVAVRRLAVPHRKLAAGTRVA
jgi:ABC-type transport system involved in multi-copper enzyme maturation, permease component